MSDKSVCFDTPLEKTKITVGQAAHDILSKPQDSQNVIDTQKEMQKKYLDNVIEAALQGVKDYGKEKPFYVCVQTRRERLLTNVIRNQFYARRTRPDPQYDLALFHFDPIDEKLCFVWCIPDKETVQYLILNESKIEKNEMQLLHFCKSFIAGTLI